MLIIPITVQKSENSSFCIRFFIFLFYKYNREDEKVVQLQGGIYQSVKKMDS